MLRHFLPLAGLLSVWLLFFFPDETHARSYEIEAVDLQAYILPDGDLYVEELFTYTFNGDFNGTTRTIGEDGHKGIEFFEAYDVPIDTKMGHIPQDIPPLKVELDDATFNIHRPSQNETIKVFYRYRVKEPLHKYEDIGEFYWRFFDDLGSEDLHHLRIFISLWGKKQLPENSHGFMHDLTGGTYQLTESGLYYENEELPGGEPVELRLLFPNNFLSEMDYTAKKEALPTILKEEEQYEERLHFRNQWVDLFDNGGLVFFLIFSLIALFAIFYPKRLVNFIKVGAPIPDIQKLDSLTLSILAKNRKLVEQDIFAALFSLYQKGIVSVHYTPSERTDHRAPNDTFQFQLEKDYHHLESHEVYLIEWLFTHFEQGKRIFSLDQLPIQSTGTNWKNVEKKKQFQEQYKKWKRFVLTTPSLHTFIKPVRFHSFLTNIITPFWILFAICALWIGMGEYKTIIIGTVLLIVSYSFILIKKRQRVWLSLFYLAWLMFLPEAGLDIGFQSVHMMTLPLCIWAAFLPSSYPTLEGLRLKKGIKQLKKRIRKKQLELPSQIEDIEKIYQHALTLGVGTLFYIHYEDELAPLNERALIYPFLIAPAQTADIYGYYHTYMGPHSNSSSSSGGSSGSSGGSGGGGGAGAF